ncbi:MAG TPA: hypothetical protein VK957_08955 [Lunatimonas sp.]|nr:hypothetical protein [Lunatimonas sp.]
MEINEMVRLAKKFNLTLCQVGFNEKVDDEWISVVDGKPKPKVKEVTVSPGNYYDNSMENRLKEWRRAHLNSI